VSERSYIEEISIRNLGVIDTATVELSPGFTVLTGETGAGKTMILTALSLVLGGKSDSSLVRQGEERLLASATFALPSTFVKELSTHDNEEVADYIEDGQLILARTVTSAGKSKATAGGVSVPLSTLSELGELFVEIHSQAASMSITKVARQRELLDRFAGAPLHSALRDFQMVYAEHRQLQDRLIQAKKSRESRDKEVAELLIFISDCKKVQPESNEFTSLSVEFSRLSSVEQLRVAVDRSVNLLNDDENGILTLLNQARKSLESATAMDSTLEPFSVNLAESFFLASDSAQSLNSYLSALEADPARLEYILSRRAEISAFVKKHGAGGEIEEEVARALQRYSDSEVLVADLSGGEERILQMQSELDAVFARLLKAGAKLSSLRSKFAEELSEKVSTEIKALSMPHTNMVCLVESLDYQSQLRFVDFSPSGGDEISMLLQSHKDAPLVPIAKGASGGELSRVMLALEVVLAQSAPVGTYIFDEIDAGVGGKAAVEVGRRLLQLSRHAQVIVVTHLTQVAAWADAHFVLRKSNDGRVVQSGIEKVDKQSRVEEIARMLAGQEDSRSAREHAAELLNLPK